MQALTNDLQREFPGVVIYGIGDAAHKLHASGHNEDDTPGSKAELQDADTIPEHRAIDVMLGSAFNKSDGDRLVSKLLADPAARARLYYIIWYGSEWSRSNGWAKIPYTGTDKHTNHVHLSGWASDDANTSGWPAVSDGGGNELFCKKGDQGEAVKALQVRLNNLGFNPGTIDGDYGSGTTAALKAACRAANPSSTSTGESYDAYTMFYVDMLMARKYGGSTPGAKGDKGDPGKNGVDGRDATLILPERLTFEATVRPVV